MEGRDQSNFNSFRDCFSVVLINKLAPQITSSLPRASRKKRLSGSSFSTSITKAPPRSISMTGSPVNDNPANDPADLADFVEYLSTEAFYALPADLRSLSHQLIQDSRSLSDEYSVPLSLTTVEGLIACLPPSVSDTLLAYGLISPPSSDLQSFMTPIFANYVNSVTTPPPKWIDTRANACEICDRDWVPITYHHLIPRQVHPKVLKRGWHEEHQLNSVAWLCRACHSFIHNMASNEELAREWYTVERICERKDVQKWAQWVQRVRWKKT